MLFFNPGKEGNAVKDRTIVCSSRCIDLLKDVKTGMAPSSYLLVLTVLN